MGDTNLYEKMNLLLFLLLIFFFYFNSSIPKMTLLAACDQTATLHLCHIWIFKAQVSNCQQRNDGFKTIMDFRGSVITGVLNATITFGEALIVDYELHVILTFIMGVKPVAMWKKETL